MLAHTNRYRKSFSPGGKLAYDLSMTSDFADNFEDLDVAQLMITAYRPGGTITTSEVVEYLERTRIIAGWLDGSHVGSPGTVLISILVTNDGNIVCEDAIGGLVDGAAVEGWADVFAHTLNAHLDIDEDTVITPDGSPFTDSDGPRYPSDTQSVFLYYGHSPRTAIMLGGLSPAPTWYGMWDNTVITATSQGATVTGWDDISAPSMAPFVSFERSGDIWDVQWGLSTKDSYTFRIATGPDMEPLTHSPGDTTARHIAEHLAQFTRVTEETPTGKFDRSLLDHPLQQLLNHADELTALPGELFVTDLISRIGLPPQVAHIIMTRLTEPDDTHFAQLAPTLGLTALTDLPHSPIALETLSYAVEERTLRARGVRRPWNVWSRGTRAGLLMGAAWGVLLALAGVTLAVSSWNAGELNWFEGIGLTFLVGLFSWTAWANVRALPVIKQAPRLIPTTLRQQDEPFV